MKVKCQKCSNEFSLKTNKAERSNDVICPSCGAVLIFPTPDEMRAHMLGLDVPTDGKRMLKLASLYIVFIFLPAYILLGQEGKYVEYLWPVLLVSIVLLIAIQFRSMNTLDAEPILLRIKNGT